MDTVERVEAFPLRIPRPTPYLGGLEPGVEPNEKGLFIRPGNRTIYSVHDHTVLVRVTTRAGQVGWGECFGVVAPEIVATIVMELAEPMVVGRNPHQVAEVYDDLYDSQRVRGYFGGFWHDALAGIDQALWDLRGKLLDLPVRDLLGSQRLRRLPAYVSGLPGSDLQARAAVAKDWMERGFNAVKFAGAVAHEGELAEIRAVREAIGPDPQILADFHWRYTGSEAVAIIRSMEPYGLAVAEAPVKPEDVVGLAHVARSVQTPVAAGEELRTVHEYLPRLEARAMSIVQPEMLHTGITGFHRICQAGGRVPLPGDAARDHWHRHRSGRQPARRGRHPQLRDARVPAHHLPPQFAAGGHGHGLPGGTLPPAGRPGFGGDAQAGGIQIHG